MKYIGIPALLFRELLPQINDMAELKAALYLFHHLSSKRGFPRFVTLEELLADGAVSAAFSSNAFPAQELRLGLAQAVEHGIFLTLEVRSQDYVQTLYLLNSEQDRKAVAAIGRGELVLSGLAMDGRALEVILPPQQRPDIFTLYEQNIGLVTPIIAEQLGEATEAYPAEWIEEAFQEAVELNKRSWRYIEAILKRWETEGRGEAPSGEHHGAVGRLPQATIDPKKYTRGPYGPLFRD